jgi:hypothetical protein
MRNPARTFGAYPTGGVHNGDGTVVSKTRYTGVCAMGKRKLLIMHVSDVTSAKPVCDQANCRKIAKQTPMAMVRAFEHVSAHHRPNFRRKFADTLWISQITPNLMFCGLQFYFTVPPIFATF